MAVLKTSRPVAGLDIVKTSDVPVNVKRVERIPLYVAESSNMELLWRVVVPIPTCAETVRGANSSHRRICLVDSIDRGF